jgi:hypothetical protein
LGVGATAVVVASQVGRDPAKAFNYLAPNTPTAAAVVIDTSTAYVQGPTFVGSGDAVHDSTQVQIDTLRGGDFSAPIIDSISGAQVRDTLASNTLLMADSLYQARIRYKADPNKGGWSAWSAPDTFVNTVYLIDQFMPAGFTDTLYYYDFSDSTTTVTTGDGSLSAGGVSITNHNQTTHGGQITGFRGGSGHLLDSLPDIPNLASGPYAWEDHRLIGNNAGSLDIYQTFIGGAVDRFYIRWTAYYHPTWVFNGNSDKMWRTGSEASNELLVSGGGQLNLANIPFSGTNNCYPYNNSWSSYAGNESDTLSGSFGACGNKGALTMESGIVQHWFLCLDASPADGAEIASWGVTTTDYEGIAAYWDDLTLAETFSGGYINTSRTPAGASPDVDSSWYLDDMVVTTGTGSCTVPPGF